MAKANATRGLSRNEVESLLSDTSSDLYGYEYASRSLFKDLLFSYTSWDGNDGLHGDVNAIVGVQSFFSDFGASSYMNFRDVSSVQTADGFIVSYKTLYRAEGLYGAGGMWCCKILLFIPDLSG